MTDDQQRARETHIAVMQELRSRYTESGSPARRAALGAAIDALRAAPEGFVVCPEDPTASMIRAGLLFGLTPNQVCTIYQSMLAARPQGVK